MPKTDKLDAHAIAIIKKRLAPLTGAKPGQLLVPIVFYRYVKAEDKEAFLQSLPDQDLHRIAIWMMPFEHTSYMGHLNAYRRQLDKWLTRADHLDEADRMYRVCRAIVNERRGAKW